VNENDNVWTSRPTDPPTYGAEVVPAKENTYQITRWLGPENPKMVWHWKPSNPYDIITGSIEVEEWIFIQDSTYNVLFYGDIIFGAFLFNWLLWKGWDRLQRRRKGVRGVSQIETKA